MCKCGISLKGKVFIEQFKPNLRFELENAKQLEQNVVVLGKRFIGMGMRSKCNYKYEANGCGCGY